MTNLEAMKNIINYPLKEGSFMIALQRAGILPTEQFVIANAKALDVASSWLILTVLTSPKSVSEGGYSITYADRDALLKARSLLLSYWDLPDTEASSINDVSFLH